MILLDETRQKCGVRNVWNYDGRFMYKKITKYLYATNKWHEEIMEQSWVNCGKCLLDRLYKLGLTYLYFFGIYFNVDFFFRILGGRTSLISSNQNLFYQM